MGNIEATRHKARDIIGNIVWLCTSHPRWKGSKDVVSRLSGAAFRMVLVMMLVATPTVLLADVSADTKQMVALIAFFVGLLTFVEYNSTYPSLVEFRDAPPFNRVRFIMLFATVLSLSVIARGRMMPNTLTDFVDAVGTLIGISMDFPYSPVRLTTLMVSDSASAEQISMIRTAAGMSYLISLISLTVFVFLLKGGQWPNRSKPFNVWINLPTFDPSAGADVVTRLTRDARINIALGFLLPFLTPAVVKMGVSGFAPLALSSPQPLIWTMTAWAFLPASLFMRGIAMGRIADLIAETRAANQLAQNGKQLSHA